MKIESTHLLTLSAFVDQIKEENSSVSSREAQSIILYNDFLKQELNVEILEELFFGEFYQDIKGRIWFEACFVKTANDLAEATKENPLRFKKQPYYEPIH